MCPRFATRATFVSDTNFVSWTQRTFLKMFRNISCVRRRGAQQCCLVLPRTGNIAGHNVAATMCPRFARALDWPYRDDFVRVISFGGFEIYDGKYVCTTEPQFLSLELSLVSSSVEQLRGKHECIALGRDLPISCFQFHSKSSSTFEWVDQLYNLHAWPGFDADRTTKRPGTREHNRTKTSAALNTSKYLK